MLSGIACLGPLNGFSGILVQLRKIAYVTTVALDMPKIFTQKLFLSAIRNQIDIVYVIIKKIAHVCSS